MSDERLTTHTAAINDPLEIEMSPENSLIVQPDILYPMTTMARAVGCARRPLVMDLVKRNGVYVPISFLPFSAILTLIAPFADQSTANRKVLYGNLQHELFQTMLRTRQFSPADIQAHLNALLLSPEYQLEMWSCGLTLEQVRTRVGCKARLSLAAFGDKWVGAEPKVSL